MVRYSFDIQSSIHSQVALPADHVTCITMADFDDPADLPEEFHVRRLVFWGHTTLFDIYM